MRDQDLADSRATAATILAGPALRHVITVLISIDPGIPEAERPRALKVLNAKCREADKILTSRVNRHIAYLPPEELELLTLADSALRDFKKHAVINGPVNYLVVARRFEAYATRALSMKSIMLAAVLRCMPEASSKAPTVTTSK